MWTFISHSLNNGSKHLVNYLIYQNYRTVIKCKLFLIFATLKFVPIEMLMNITGTDKLTASIFILSQDQRKPNAVHEAYIIAFLSTWWEEHHMSTGTEPKGASAKMIKASKHNFACPRRIKMRIIRRVDFHIIKAMLNAVRFFWLGRADILTEQFPEMLLPS